LLTLTTLVNINIHLKNTSKGFINLSDYAFKHLLMH